MWNTQKKEVDKKIIYLRLEDISLQNIIGMCSHSNKGSNYMILKDRWNQEQYLSILDDKYALDIFKFRTTNHRLPVETGRFYNIPYKDRICTQCHRDIGDEFHYLLKCPAFDKDRKKFLLKQHIKHPNMMTFKNIMTSTNIKLLHNLSVLVKHIMFKIKT